MEDEGSAAPRMVSHEAAQRREGRGGGGGAGAGEGRLSGWAGQSRDGAGARQPRQAVQGSAAAGDSSGAWGLSLGSLSMAPSCWKATPPSTAPRNVLNCGRAQARWAGQAPVGGGEAVRGGASTLPRDVPICAPAEKAQRHQRRTRSKHQKSTMIRLSRSDSARWRRSLWAHR